MRILLTGYAGFLGRNIARQLRNNDNIIRVVLHKKTVTKSDFNEEADEYIWGSLEDSRLVEHAVKDVDIVIHCAWQFNSQGTKRPTQNEIIIKQLIKECAKAGVKKFLFFSSVAVYGMQDIFDRRLDECSQLVSPSDEFIYPAEKIAAEQIIKAEGREKMSIGIFRPGPIYSEEKSPIKKMISLPGLKLAIGFGTGKNTMPYIHVNDVAAAVINWMDADYDYSVYNLTPDFLQSHRDWYIAWGKKNGSKITPLFLRSRIVKTIAYTATLLKRIAKKPGDVNLSYAISAASRRLSYSNERARLELGWKPLVTDTYKND